MNADNVDFALLQEVMLEVRDHVPELENDLHRLVQSPYSSELLSSAFRHMHTLKGDFGYCRAVPIIDFLHLLECVMQSMRDRKFRCSALIAEAIMQSIDQVLSMMQVLAKTRQFDTTPRTHLVGLIRQLAGASSQDEADQTARHILLAAHGAWVAEPEDARPASVAASPASIQRALDLGELLAAALEQRIPGWRGRTALQLRLVLELNQHYPNPCDPNDLTIAVYWHDVGLLTLSDAVLAALPSTSKSPGWSAYAAHPERAIIWLQTIAPDCSEAARIIGQHHLWANGAGIRLMDYPPPLHPGAMMLACADSLADRVAGLSGEDYRRAVLRTLFDVNSGLDTRFDPVLINVFDVVAREFSLSAV